MKKLVIWIMMFVVLCSFVVAADCTSGNDAIEGYTWDNADNFTDVSGNGHTITNDGTEIASGKINEARDYVVGNTDLLQIGAPELVANYNNYSIVCWVKSDLTTNDGVFYSEANSGNDDFFMRIMLQKDADGGDIYFQHQSSGTDILVQGGADVNDGTFHHIVVTRAGSLFNVFVDGGLDATGSAAVGALTNDRAAFGVLWRQTPLAYFDGQIDECYIYNRTLSGTEINESYNFNGSVGLGCQPYAVAPAVESLNLSVARPVNGSGLNSFPLVFNLTANGTFDFNCSFLLNGSVNQTLNFNNGTNVFVNVSLGNLSDGEYNYQFSCFNNETVVNSSVNTFFVDFEPPVIVDNFVNNSMYSEGNVTGQFNFSDNQLLHSLNVTVDDVMIFNITHIHQPTFVFNLSLPVVNVSVGRHVLGLEIADGHTAVVLGGDYGVVKGKDSLKYNFWDDGFVRTTSDVGGVWESVRKVDRYSQVFVPDVPSETLVFVEESDLPIYVYDLPGSFGDRWLVVGRHWKDYVVEGESDAEVSIKRISERKVEVTVTGIKNRPWRVVLNSIGDLNIVRREYDFYRLNLTESFDSIIFSNFETNLTLNASFGNLTFNFIGLVPAAILQWNNTNFTASLVSFDSESAIFIQNITPFEISNNVSISHKWFFNFSNLTQGFLNTSLVNQTIFNVSVSVCGGNNTYPIVNFTYFNDVSGVAINLTNGYALAIFDGTFYYNQTGSFVNNQTSSFCTNIPPLNSTYNWNMWGTLTLSAAGFVTRIFTIPEAGPTLISNNPVTNLSLFLIDLGNSSTVTFTWLTEEIQPIDGTLLIFRCNPDGTRSLIESTPIVTGQAVANIQLVIQTYSYEVVIGGVTFTDDSFTTCHIEASTSVTYYVDVLGLDLVPVIGLFLIDCTLEKLGNTTVRMRWQTNPFNTEVIEGCLVGYRNTVNGLVQIYENCSVGNVNSIVRTVPDNSFDYFIEGRMSQGNNSGYCQQSVSFIREAVASELFGIMGLLSGFFIVLSMALVFAGDGESTVIAGGVGFVIAWIFGIFIFDWKLVSAVIAFLGIIVVVGRYTRK